MQKVLHKFKNCDLCGTQSSEQLVKRYLWAGWSCGTLWNNTAPAAVSTYFITKEKLAPGPKKVNRFLQIVLLHLNSQIWWWCILRAWRKQGYSSRRPGESGGRGRGGGGGCPRTRPPWLMWFDLDSGPVIHQGLDLAVAPPCLCQIHLITGTLRSKLSAVSFVAWLGTLLYTRGSVSEVPSLIV